MITAKHCKEVSIRVANDTNSLSKLTKIIAEKGINVLAACAWVEDENIEVIHLVTEDNLRVLDALTANKYTANEIASISVEVEHKSGMLNRVSSRLHDVDIRIRYLYVSAPINQEQCLMILSTEDNDQALLALNT